MPDIPVLDHAQTLGLSMPGGMGEAPVTAQEIKAWAEGEGVSLSPWEFRMLRRLSRAFVSGLHATDPPGAPVQTKAILAAADAMVDAGRASSKR